ncbi:unnamed protein product [Mytilus coruscus]|uniref:Peptidase A2 domain-containing protein n=1 Tax=Mytilus coruscus TaxID=42192 RepID=A0A6J8AZG9_MYTCO|nr:unnamed protein product [Mytilus coruscus]
MGDEAAPIIIPTNYGRIDEFDDNSEDWIEYTERLNHYFIANNIESMEKKRAIFLSACGKKTYKLMRNLNAPQKPGKKSYDDIVKLVTDHQNPKPSSIVQRCIFNSRSRQPNESVSQFVAELRQISEHCDYKATLDDMLRDRLVCGIKEDRIQRRLLAEPGLTFKKAMEVATAMEMAAKNAQDLQVQEPKPVHKVTVRNEECYRCGGPHNAHDCKWKDAKCYAYDKKGHLAKESRNRGKQNATENPKFKQSPQHGKGYSKQRPTKTHFVEEDTSECEETYSLYQVQTEKRKPYCIKAEVNNMEIELEIDTDAAVTIFSKDTLKRIFGSEETHLYQTGKLRTYTGEEIRVVGKTTVTVMCNNQSARLPITVVKGVGSNLMGRDWLEHLKLDWKSIFRVEESTNGKNRELEAILYKYTEVFEEGLGTLKGTKAKTNLNSDAIPKYFKA